MSTYPTKGLIWRIDDRLIHGQVIVGWCSQLPIKRLVVCDDEIAQNEWEKNLLLIAAPSDIPVEILSVSECAEKSRSWMQEEHLTLILLRSVDTLIQLVEQQVPIQEVNIGGIHFKEDRHQYLPYVFLSREEVQQLRELMSRGIHFTAQDLPNGTAYDLNKILEKEE